MSGLARTPVAAGVRRRLGVRAGEGRVLGLVALLFLALEGGRGLGEVGADTLVLGRFGADALPYLFIGLGVTSLGVALAFGAALGRVPRPVLLAGIPVVAAALLLAGAVAAMGAPVAVPAIWLATYAAGAIGTTVAWSVAGSVFDVRQAKRLYPLCIGAAIAGGFVGSLAAGPLARILGTEALVAAEAGLLLAVGALVAAVGRTGQVRAPARSARRPLSADLRMGLDEVLRSPLFRLAAIAYVLFSVLNFSVTFPFLQVAAATYPDEADLATVIGLLSAAVTATSFVVSLGLANRVYARFGVATAALVLPLVYLVGFGLWLVEFSFAAAAGVRFAQQVTQRGLSNATWGAFYAVIPGDRRAQVLAFMDGVPGQLGMVVSGALLLAAGAFLAADQLFWVGAATAFALCLVVLGIRRQYGASLLRTLRSGMAEQVLEGGPGLTDLGADPQVATALAIAAGAPEAAVRRMALTLIARTRSPDAEAMLVAGLADPDSGVRVAAVRGLAELGVDDLPARLAGLRDDPALTVRAAVAVALDATGTSPGGVARLLHDESSEVRQAVIEAIGAVGGLRRGETIAADLLAALDDDSPLVRRTAALLLAARDADTPGVLETLLEGSVRAQDAALVALVGHGDAVRTEVGRWAQGQIARATAWRAARRSLETGDAVPADTAVGFLASVLTRREQALADRALGALAVLGAVEARGVIRRCLRSSDPETRAQALEALDSIGDRHLGRSIVDFLDAEAGEPAEPRGIVLTRLAADDDPWVRALAERAIADERAGDEMAETERTTSQIDTMLLLRRVPLFAQLDPEDLQRIARTCSERTYQAGEVLMQEGEIGSELLVLIEGSVRVVRRADDGERLLRTYAAGDHFGELAVLREAPRAATVVADDDIRALVIDGESLKAILRERPDAAMAMLATLAERISVQ